MPFCKLSTKDNNKLCLLHELAILSDVMNLTGYRTLQWKEVRKFYKDLGFRYKFPVHAATIMPNGDVVLDGPIEP